MSKLRTIWFLANLLACAALYGQVQPVQVGAARFDLYIPLLAGKQVGLVVNHTSRVGDAHLVDTLLARGVCVRRVFAPEHGYRGTADDGADIRDGYDHRAGLPLRSLYGKRKKPSPDDLQDLDVVVFDIQDVGARFYTFISTLFYVAEACAENGVELLVLDRPNPNGHYLDGPLLEQGMESFVGIAPIPMVHGCTIGELARLFAGEGFIKSADRLKLRVIPCANYTHRTRYVLPIKPSPNLPDERSVLLYPSVCLFEGTAASVGRGTETPFQWVGHPAFPAGDSLFIPCPTEGAQAPLHEGDVCKGYDLRRIQTDSLYSKGRINLGWLLDFYCEFPDKGNFFRKNKYFDLLAGTPYLRELMEMGSSEETIRASWADGLAFFRLVRKDYLLYDE